MTDPRVKQLSFFDDEVNGQPKGRGPYNTLGRAKEYVLANVKAGTCCPCCGTHLKLYRRKLNAGMARGLIILYQASLEEGPEEWIHVSKYFLRLQRIGIALEYPKLRYWGLLEPLTDERTNGQVSGFWRLTDLGREFVRGVATVPRRVYLMAPQQRFMGFDGDLINIQTALGNRFNYVELMSGGS